MTSTNKHSTGARRPRPGVRALTAGLSALGLLLAGCSATGSGATPTAGGGATTTSTTAPPTTTTVPPTTTTTEQPGWSGVSSAGTAVAVDTQSVTLPTGHVVTIVRFRAGVTHFHLHVGGSDPPRGTAMVTADDGSSIGPDEAPALLAAFNGGFEASAGVGGFELAGQVLVPLQAGAASLVIDSNGSAHVGVWGQSLPAPGEPVDSVRQNLAPLVAGGQPSPQVNDIAAWGATLGGGPTVARSALGEDRSGDLLYAAGMHVLPVDLADALVGAGAVTAMQLDINPEWVQLAWAPEAGGPLSPAVPGQNRPGDQYQVGWTRDFITVTAAG